MHNLNIHAWLERIQSVHVTDMDLSLERVAEVAKRLNIKAPLVTTVGGTNGKGSCVAGLEAIYLKAGYRVGAFTSPILFRHNEYVRVQGIHACDDEFCEAFAKIEKARGDITLTPFEFNALAAFSIFQKAHLDIWILEVGLGGRFDAVNVIDADVMIVVSIGIDHVEWLGDTREKIAYEKAGIFRSGKPAICGDFDTPHTLIDYAHQISAPLFLQNKQFGFEKNEGNWNWWYGQNHIDHLPLPKLALQNMSCVLMAVELLQEKLPIDRSVIPKALVDVTLTGRIQLIPGGDVEQIFDVSHNPASAEFLATWLQEHPCRGKTWAVFSMLGDKDIVGTIQVMRDFIDEWLIAPIAGVKRAAPLERLQGAFNQALITRVKALEDIKNAYQYACDISQKNDRIVVFGSFHTVAEGINCIKSSINI